MATIALMVTTLAMFPNAAFASTTPGGPPIPPAPATSAASTTNSSSYRIPVKQDATWLAAKNGYRVVSGIDVTKPRKGQSINPKILSVSPLTVSPLGCPSVAVSSSVTPLCGGGAPAAKLLTLDQYAGATFEPSDGTAPNYGANTAHTDENGQVYGTPGSSTSSNHDFYLLCGSGASDIVLDFWPAPPNLLVNTQAHDPDYDNAVGSTRYSYWGGTFMRGYMTYLAWQTQAPTWPTPGMMDTSVYPSHGVTQYDVVEALNWNASGKNVNGWHSYFYTIRWWSDPGVTAATLNSDIVSDIGTSGVPVQAEANLQLLTNGNGSGHTNHQIAIIGYDNNAGTYTYVDTCAYTTNCSTNPTNNSSRRTFTISQSQMWNAITNIPVNKDWHPQNGDGGWVW